MSRSGLRFFATRSGGCSHNLVEMRVEQDEIEQHTSELVGGGGPEGLEHLWIKGRLYIIAKALGTEAIVEHSATRADVFLPEHNLDLEYQRWNTDFLGRTAQQPSAAAAPPKSPLECVPNDMEHSPGLSDEMPASAGCAELALGPLTARHASEHTAQIPDVAPSVASTASTAQPPETQQPTQRKSWWSVLSSWLRQV